MPCLSAYEGAHLINQLPPVSGQMTLAELATFLGVAESQLGVAGTAALGVVAYESSAGVVWPFAMTLRIDAEDAPEEEAIHAGPAWLVRRRATLTSLADPDSLQRFLSSWASLVKPDGVLRDVQHLLNAIRHPGHNLWHRLPCWTIDMPLAPPSVGTSTAPPVPHRPVVVPTRLFARSVVDAAAQYLGLSDLRGRSMPVDGVKVLVADPRAYFDGVEETARGARFFVAGRRVPGNLVVGVTRIAPNGSHTDDHVVVANGQCEVTAEPARSIEVQLVGDDSEPYDTYSEYAGQPVGRTLLLGRDSSIAGIREAPRPTVPGATAAPSDAMVSEVLEQFSVEAVYKAWTRALNRRATDPDGALTAARTLLETVCKHILADRSVAVPDRTDLVGLYRLVAQELDLAPDAPSDAAVKQVLGGCFSVVNGIGRLRNLFGDAHGRAPGEAEPSDRHVQLAVNVAGTLAAFLVATSDSSKGIAPPA